MTHLLLRLISLLAASASAAAATLTGPVAIPVTVNVGLLGFSGDGAWQLELDAAELYGLLHRLLPERRPSCGPDGRAADAVYKFTYNVVHMRTGLKALHKALVGSILRHPPSTPTSRLEVHTADVADYFTRTYESYFAADPTAAPDAAGGTSTATFAILVINPNRADMASMLHEGGAPHGDLQYHYVVDGAGGVPTQMWVSSGRYLVLDLSAGPVARGMSETPEGAVSSGSVPEVGPSHRGGPQGAAERAADPTLAAAHADAHTHLLAELTSLLLSGISHVITPDVRSCALPESWSKLVVPLVVLTNHRAFDPLEAGHAHSLDVAALETQIGRLLLPSQTLTLLPSTHHIHDHPQISIALTRAARADTQHAPSADGAMVPTAQPYLDSAGLVHALRHSVDWLAAGLMHRSETPPAAYHLHEAWSNTAGRSTGSKAGATKTAGRPSTMAEHTVDPGATRVLPVFVFSLLGMHPSLLLDKSSLVHATDHAVVVLQTNSTALPVPFYADAAAPLTISTAAPTPHALAGLASSLGAVLAPFESFGAPDGRPTYDFHWAVGHHPFGPFASANVLPDVMVDAARRHALLSRLAAAADLLHDAVDALEALAARYVHPAEVDSPVHRQQVGQLHEDSYDRSGEGGYERAMRHLDEEARGVAHAPQEERRYRAAQGAPPGELLRRVRDGSLTLSSELATRETKRLHARLSSHLPELDRVGELIAAGELAMAHLRVALLLKSVGADAAATNDEVRGLAATLSCCTIHTRRPSTYRLLEIGGVLLLCGGIFGAVLWMSAPEDDGRGPRVRSRPGEGIGVANTIRTRFPGLWGGRRRDAAKEY